VDEIAALLATLRRLAGEPCSADEIRSRTITLVNSYSAALHERLGITSSKRPTASAKSAADQTLSALRGQILAVEARSSDPLRTALAVARHRVEMTRRVLAMRLVEGGEPPLMPEVRATAQQQPRPRHTATQLDREILASLRLYGGRDHMARSRAAIADSRRLLAACPAGHSARLGC
jgi:hypothetical protein